MTKALVHHGCDINIHLESGNTPLSYAVHHRDAEIIKVLLDANADPNMPKDDESLDSAFDDAILDLEDGKDTEIVDLLLATGRCRINRGKYAAGSVFCYILGKAQREEWDVGLAEDLALRMLKNAQNIDEDRDDGGCTLLHVAVLREREIFVDILLQRGADLEARDGNGLTPFLMACQFAPNMLQHLIDRGANTHVKFRTNASALALAAGEGNVEATKFLINLGHDINEKTGKGRTPLACALSWGQEQTALALMQHGADVHWVTQEKCKTALHFAARKGLENATRELLKQDVDVNAQSRGGWTPLHEVCLVSLRSAKPVLLTLLGLRWW
jgi:ankyrin repeat protein